jgi:hypothetical protein
VLAGHALALAFLVTHPGSVTHTSAAFDARIVDLLGIAVGEERCGDPTLAVRVPNEHPLPLGEHRTSLLAESELRLPPRPGPHCPPGQSRTDLIVG